jgi:hypothetical protein
MNLTIDTTALECGRPDTNDSGDLLGSARQRLYVTFVPFVQTSFGMSLQLCRLWRGLTKALSRRSTLYTLTFAKTAAHPSGAAPDGCCAPSPYDWQQAAAAPG